MAYRGPNPMLDPFQPADPAPAFMFPPQAPPKSSNMTVIIVIVVLLIAVLVASFFAWRSSQQGGGGSGGGGGGACYRADIEKVANPKLREELLDWNRLLKAARNADVVRMIQEVILKNLRHAGPGVPQVTGPPTTPSRADTVTRESNGSTVTVKGGEPTCEDVYFTADA